MRRHIIRFSALLLVAISAFACWQLRQRQTWLDAAFTYLLGHPPSQIERWTLSFRSAAAQAEAIVRSPSVQKALIEGWYLRYLRRGPLNDELDGWLQTLAETEYLEARHRFLGSEELYQSVARGEPMRFVDLLYTLELRRKPGSWNPAEHHTLSALVSDPYRRVAIAFNVLRSRERLCHWIVEMFYGLTGVVPRTDQLEHWLEAMEGGVGEEDILAQILRSEEFRQRTFSAENVGVLLALETSTLRPPDDNPAIGGICPKGELSHRAPRQ